MKLKSWPPIKPIPQLARVLLVYGPDAGQVAARSKDAAQMAVSDLNDPFNVCTLTTADIMAEPDRFWNETAAQSLMGGDRLIWVKDADDKLSPVIKSYLDDPAPHCFVLLEAGDLSSKSPLRALGDKIDLMAALACYVEEERDLSRHISTWIKEENFSITPDALMVISQNVRGDQAVARAEVDKLLLYMHSATNKTITEADVLAVSSDTRSENIDAIMLAAPQGDIGKTMTAWKGLTADGTSAIAVLRVLQTHFRRLLKARLLHEETNMPIDAALNQLQPKPFFKVMDAMRLQAKRWNAQELQAGLDALIQCETLCKRTGYVPETLTGWCLLALCRKQPQLWHTQIA